MFSLNDQFCIILTHRHGACVGLFRRLPQKIIKENFLHTAENFFAQKKSLIKIYQNFEYIEEDCYVIARALGKTAENLLHLYQFADSMLRSVSAQHENVKSRLDRESRDDMKQFVFGAGPGSFTGLRLGCAFINGMSLPINAKRYSISTMTRDEAITLFSMDIREEFLKELGKYQENDQSSGYITFFDMLFSIHQIMNHNIEFCDTLLPRYGREPTPVINLRKG